MCAIYVAHTLFHRCFRQPGGPGPYSLHARSRDYSKNPRAYRRSHAPRVQYCLFILTFGDLGEMCGARHRTQPGSKAIMSVYARVVGVGLIALCACICYVINEHVR